MNKKGLLIVGIFLIFLINSVYASFNVSLSDQGTNAKYKNNWSVINNGNLEVTIYDSLTGGNLIYNETFTGVIINGSWNVMLGENSTNNLSLEFGKIYYKDYKINGQDLNFTDFYGNEVERRFFYSPLGDVGGEDISPISNLTIASLNISGLMYINTSGIDLGTGSNLYLANTNNQVSFRLRRFGTITSPNADIIAIIQGRAPDSTGAEAPFAEMGLLATNITDGSEKGAIVFKTIDSGTFKEQMRITDTGYVGIGTNNPSAQLHINDTTTTLRIESNDPSHKDQAALVIGGKWGDSTAAYASLVLGSDGTTNTLDDTYRLQVFDGAAWKVPLLLYKNGDIALSGTAAGASPIMYLNDTSGKVGINTSSPTHTLNVVGDLNVTGISYLGNLVIDAENITFDNAISKSGSISFWNTTGSELMTIVGNGNIGIGTTNPNATLEIETATKNGTIFQLESTAADSYPAIKFVNDVREWRIYGADGSQGDAFTIYDATAPATRFAIDTNGDVGIGTAYPDAKLEIETNAVATAVIQLKSTAANSYPVIKFVNDVREWRIYGADGSQGDAFIIYDGTALGTRFAIDTSGEVGIGTAYPNSLLEIKKRGGAGYNLNVSGLLYVNDTNVGIGTTSSTYLLEIANSATAMNVSGNLYVNSTNVGIGTANPEGQLHLASSNATNPAYIDIYDDGAVYPQIYLRKSDNDAIGTKSTTDNSDWLGAIYFQGVDSGSIFDYGAYIAARQTGASGSFVPTSIIMSTWSSTAQNQNQLVLYNDGNVGIGTATPTHTLNVVGDLNVTGTSYLGNLIINADNITTNNIISKSGNISFWSSTNDEIVRFVDNGNVGIGTTSPGSILDVRQSVNGGPATLRIENTYALAGSTDETVDIQGRFGDTSSVSEYAFRILGIKENDYSAAANMDASLAFSVALNGGYNEAIRILSNGRVGIGNSTPSDTLEVQGGVTANGAFTSDVANDGGMTIHQTVGGGGGIAYNIRTSNGGGWAWRFVDGTATSPVNEYFKVTYSSGDTWARGVLQVNGTGNSYILGNLGIGTISPSAKLDVRGSGNFSGTIYINNATDISTLGNSSWNQSFANTLYAPNTTAGIQYLINNTNINFATLGIGTANPTQKVEVAGNLNVSSGGNISVAGCITFSTGGQICGV